MVCDSHYRERYGKEPVVTSRAYAPAVAPMDSPVGGELAPPVAVEPPVKKKEGIPVANKELCDCGRPLGHTGRHKGVKVKKVQMKVEVKVSVKIHPHLLDKIWNSLDVERKAELLAHL
jgi:hypothetical protein